GGLPEEVLCAFTLQQDVEAAVRRTDSRAHRVQTIRVETRRLNGRWLGRFGVFNPCHELQIVERNLGFHGAAIELAKNAAPVPLGESRFDLGLAPTISELGSLSAWSRYALNGVSRTCSRFAVTGGNSFPMRPARAASWRL